MTTKPLKIGITMRVVQADGYDESRDALAQDWTDFMAEAFPEAVWMPIANMGKDIIPFIKEWEINAFIFSGGNDIGSAPERDETERAILDYALENNQPVFGVCRGMQFIQHYFGGELQTCDANVHVAQQHKVIICDDVSNQLQVDVEQVVNSYHNQGIEDFALAKELEPIAITPDRWIEGVEIPNTPVRAVMWHPERDKPYRQTDIQLMRDVFVNGASKNAV